MTFALFLLGAWTEPKTRGQGRIVSEVLEQIEHANPRFRLLSIPNVIHPLLIGPRCHNCFAGQF